MSIIFGVLLLQFASSNAFLLNHAFLSASSRYTMRTEVEVTMASATCVNHLDLTKEKYSGRCGFDNVEADLDEASSYESFLEAGDEAELPTKGQNVEGTVIEIDDNGALIEIGGKMSGYLPAKEASLVPIKHVNTILEIGQTISAEVVGTLKGVPVLSLRSSQLETAWENVLNARAADATFDVEISEVNKGGLLVTCMGLGAFLPGSHYLGAPDASLVGTKMTVKFLEVNEEDGKLLSVSVRRKLIHNPLNLKETLLSMVLSLVSAPMVHLLNLIPGFPACYTYLKYHTIELTTWRLFSQ